MSMIVWAGRGAYIYYNYQLLDCNNSSINQILLIQQIIPISKMHKSSRLNDFQIVSKLGEGSFGQVFKIKRKQDGQIYALKKISTRSMSQRDKLSALNQIRILASFEGQHIIGYKQSFFDEVSGCLCIVLQFAQQGDLSRKINKAIQNNVKIQQSQIWKALVHIAKGLKSLHTNKIIHRDLKSANIFIMEDGTYKLGDLNISKVLKRSLTQTQAGTPYYTSPQIWKNKQYGHKVDMWSLGCVLYEMATQKMPFLANDIEGLKRKVCNGVVPNIPIFYSSQLSYVIKSLLNQNPILRPSASQLLSNAMVMRNYEGEIHNKNQKKNKLLRTIKLNICNWKKTELPKPRYGIDQLLRIQQQRQKTPDRIISRQKDKQNEKIRAISYEKRVASSRSNRKSVKQIMQDKNRLNNLSQNRHSREKQKEEQLRQIKNSQRLKQKKYQIDGQNCKQDKKQRILSAYRDRMKTNNCKQGNLKLPPKPRLSQKQNMIVGIKKIDNKICHKESVEKSVEELVNNDQGFIQLIQITDNAKTMRKGRKQIRQVVL